MEKSIESIWKKGFLNTELLIAPKLNDLYNKKSQHIVDKFTRMFKINLIAIIVGSFLIAVISYLVQMPYMGVGMFVLLNTLVFINNKLLKGLLKIDKNVNSYQYLKTFQSWMHEQISFNKNFARFMYPGAVLSIIVGLWFGSFGGNIPGQILVNKLIEKHPDIIIVFGLPLYGLLAVIMIIGLLILFAGKIYMVDFNIVYGRVIKKLDEIIKDMEELRN